MSETREELEIESEICHCPCHTDNSIDHVTPCCLVCPHCKRDIKANFYDAHIARCADEHNQ